MTPVLLTVFTTLLAHGSSAAPLYLDDVVCAGQTVLHEQASSEVEGSVRNMKGDRFDIFAPGNHTLLVIPRGSDKEHALLHIRALVNNVGPPCNGWLFLSYLEFSGMWLRPVNSLELWTNMDGEDDVYRGIHFKVNHKGRFGFNVSEFGQNVPARIAKATIFHDVVRPKRVADYVTTLMVNLRAGPTLHEVRMVYQKETIGFSNSMWLSTTNLREVKDQVGGILGGDDHRNATKIPAFCAKKRKGHVIRTAPPHRGTVHASATSNKVAEG